MNKLLALGMGLLVAGAGQAQQLQGGFTNAKRGTLSFSTDYYWFSQGRFKHVGDGCTGPYSGTGTFQVLADSLQLQYGTWDTATSTAAADTTTAPLASPGIVVRVLDASTQEPLAGTTILIAGSALGAATDGAGMAKLMYAPKLGDSLVINFVGYTNLEFALRPNAAQSWTVLLAPQTGRLKGNISYLLTDWLKAYRPTTWLENRKNLLIHKHLNAQIIK